MFSKITFLKSLHSNEKDELCYSFEVEIFSKSLHRGFFTLFQSIIACIIFLWILNNMPWLSIQKSIIKVSMWKWVINLKLLWRRRQFWIKVHITKSLKWMDVNTFWAGVILTILVGFQKVCSQRADKLKKKVIDQKITLPRRAAFLIEVFGLKNCNFAFFISDTFKSKVIWKKSWKIWNF